MNNNMAHLSKHTNVIARSAPRIDVKTNVIASLGRRSSQ